MKEQSNPSNDGIIDEVTGGRAEDRSMLSNFQFSENPHCTQTNERSLKAIEAEFDFDLSEKTQTNQCAGVLLSAAQIEPSGVASAIESEILSQNEVKPSVAQKESIENDNMPNGEKCVMIHIARGILRASKSGENERTVQLDPHELGSVSITILAEGAVTKARIIVESQAVGKIMQRRFRFLKRLLSKHNINIARFEVLVARQRDVGTGAGMS